MMMSPFRFVVVLGLLAGPAIPLAGAVLFPGARPLQAAGQPNNDAVPANVSRLEGRVVDASGKPVVRAMVRIVDPEGAIKGPRSGSTVGPEARQLSPGATLLRSTRTDSEGNYRIDLPNRAGDLRMEVLRGPLTFERDIKLELGRAVRVDVTLQ